MGIEEVADSSDVANGRSGVYPGMTTGLDRACSGGADVWYRLQAARNLAQAMNNADDSEVERLSCAR